MDVELPLRNDIIRHYMEDETVEWCGAVIDGKYERFANGCEDPRLGFEINPSDIAGPLKEGRVQYIVHSHVNGFLYPSVHDQEQQIATGVDWIIAARDLLNGQMHVFKWGDCVLSAPLERRVFRHVVFDCYSAIRSWFFQNRNIKLKDFVRDKEWWYNGQDLYLQGYKEAGFVKVDGEPEEGDVFLVKLGTNVYNHGGVFLGGNRAYHHRIGRLSRIRDIAHYSKAEVIFLRYVGK